MVSDIQHHADGSITLHKTTAVGKSYAKGGFLRASRQYLIGHDPIEHFTPLPVGRVIPLSDPSNPSICPVEVARAINPLVSFGKVAPAEAVEQALRSLVVKQVRK